MDSSSFTNRSTKCVGLSAIVHMLLLTAFYLVISPVQSHPDGKLIAISLDPIESRSGSKSKSSQPNPQDINPNSEKAVEDAANDVLNEVPTDQPSDAQVPNNDNKDLEGQAGDISDDLDKRSRYGPIKPGTFYGVEIFSNDVIFIIDVSSSMDIKEARLQLKNAYHALPLETNFTIITYADHVNVWQDYVVVASKANKYSADRWLEAVDKGGATNIYDALRRAFLVAGRKSVDTMYFVTDGLPTVGLRDTDKILKQVRDWNKDGIEIHTIGIGGAQDRAFLERLAGQNGGRYYYVH